MYRGVDNGAEMSLRLKCPEQCSVGVFDRSFGLPDAGVPQRPQNKMAWYGSDVTVVGREYRF